MTDPSDERVPLDSTLRCRACGYSLRGVAADGECPECGASVAEALAMPNGNLAQLTTTRDAMQAHHLKGELESHGICAIVMGDQLASGRGELPMTAQTLPSVWVGDLDMERAVAVAGEYFETIKRDAGNLPEWRCPACSEMVDGHFDVCWNCQAPRDGD